MEEHCFLVLLELNANQSYESLFKKIKSYRGWGRLTETSWAIVSNESCLAIRDTLSRYINTGDRLIVVQSGKVAAWMNCRASGNWIKDNIVK